MDHSLTQYERLHEKITEKAAEFVVEKKREGASSALVDQRVEALKEYSTKRLNVYKNSIRVSFCF